MSQHLTTLNNHPADRLLEGQALALLGLLAVIFVTMSLMFTSVKGGLIALVPGVVPIERMAELPPRIEAWRAARRPSP